MRVYVHGAGRHGRDAWPPVQDEESRFASLDLTGPMEQNVASLTSLTPPESIVFAHSAGAVPVFLALQARLLDTQASARAQRALLHRAVLPEAITWLDIHGDRPDVVAHWRELQVEPREHVHVSSDESTPAFNPYGRRRRRRRGRRRTRRITDH